MEYDILSAMVMNGQGFSSSAQTINVKNNFAMSSILELGQPVPLGKGESAYVWGIQETDENWIRAAGIQEAMERAKWAMVFKVTVSDTINQQTDSSL